MLAYIFFNIYCKLPNETGRMSQTNVANQTVIGHHSVAKSAVIGCTFPSFRVSAKVSDGTLCLFLRQDKNWLVPMHPSAIFIRIKLRLTPKAYHPDLPLGTSPWRQRDMVLP